MNGSVSIGRIFGVPLRLHWSAPLLVAFLGYGLGSRTLPALVPGRPGAVYTAAALIGALILLLSLLLHEAAHAVTARRRGVLVEDMTLWALGGVTRMGHSESPRVLFAVAASGPLTSLLLGGAGVGLAFGWPAVLGGSVASAVLFWVGSANVLLGLFNLLPAAPLDGGRVLQALLWRRSGDRERAERTAGRGGQLTGALLMLLGVVAFLKGLPDGLWLVFIGFFVSGSAAAEIRSSALSGALRGVSAGEAMSAPVDTGPDWWTVARFIDEVARQRRHSVLPLIDFDGRPSGVVTMRQIGVIPVARREELRIRDVATPLSRCAVAAPGDDLFEVLSRGGPAGSGRILVVDGGRLVGIVTARDIARIIQQHSLEHRSHRPASPG